MKIVVIGGSGLIGSKLVAKLDEHGIEAVPASPNTGKNYLQVARELGISQSDLTSAYLGNAGATDKIKASLTRLTKASQEYVSDESGVREAWTGQQRQL